MLTGIFGALLASGADESFASNQAEYIALGLKEPLNNPFKARKTEPIKYRLGVKHWVTFSGLLRDNSAGLMGILTTAPYNFTVEEAYYESKWLVSHLDPNRPRLTRDRRSGSHRAAYSDQGGMGSLGECKYYC